MIISLYLFSKNLIYSDKKVKIRMIDQKCFKEEFMLDDNGFTIEDIRGVAKRAKYLNTVLIVITLIYFVSSWIINGMLAFSDPTMILIIFRGTTIILSIIILIFSILTFGKMRFLKIEGAGQLLASSIIFTIFALTGFLLGIVILILSAMSIRKIKESMEILEMENGGKY